MKPEKLYSTWVEVSREAIQGNLRSIQARTGVMVMAVVKANAYGHGMVAVARSARAGGASWYGVARLEEALQLRADGLEAPTLILGHTPPARFQDAIALGVSLTVWEAGQVAAAGAAASQVGYLANLHLKVDTGMGRLGARPDEALALARLIASTDGVRFEGAFTHFARADEPDPGPTAEQETRFHKFLDSLDAAGLRPPLVHAANSAAGLTRPSQTCNLVRAGIAMYGLHPSPDCPLPAGFQPALAWKAVLSQVKVVPAGQGISYGHAYITQRAERIGTIPVGYADGYRRVPGNQVLLNGRRVPVVGRVCMDQIMVQLDEVPQARAGDEVVLIGGQGGQQITAEAIAARWETINYEVTSGIAARVPRLYP